MGEFTLIDVKFYSKMKIDVMCVWEREGSRIDIIILM